MNLFLIILTALVVAPYLLLALFVYVALSLKDVID